VGKKALLYPFSLPQLELLQRARQALNKAQCWLPSPRTQPERRALSHLASVVNRVEHDTRYSVVMLELETRWQAFCELRDVLQLTNAELPNGEHRYQQLELPALEARRLAIIAQGAEAYQQELGERIANSEHTDRLHPSPADIILKYFERYGEHLCGHPALRDKDGAIVAVVERTDNVPEHFFGDQKQKLRRRVGRAHLGRDLQDQPAQVALVANLQHTDYVRIVCGSLENLAPTFAQLDEEALKQATPLLRDNRDPALLRTVRMLVKNEPKALPYNNKSEAIGPVTTEL